MNKIYKVVFCGLLLASGLSARVASELKADLEAIIPAGKSIRLAYFKGGTSIQAFPWMTGSNNIIYAVDSKDGIIRQLYPKTGEGEQLCNICLSADGQKVLFNNRGRGTSGWVKFDGSSTNVNTVNCQMNEYWRNPADGSDWMVLLNGDRMNIISKEVVSANVSGVNIGSAMTCMSDDGKCLLMQDADKGFGFYVMEIKEFTSRAGGCQPSLRAGFPYEFNINPSGHRAMSVYSLASATPVIYETSTGASAYVASRNQAGTCQEGSNANTQEGTRFTQHRDYATFTLGNSKANPILVKIGSPLKYAYIEDNLSNCVMVGDMDAVILPMGSSTVKNSSVNQISRNTISSNHDFFGIDGRKIANASSFKSNGAYKGIVFKRMKSGGVERIYK